MLRLTGKQFQQFRNLIVDAFTLQRFDELLLFKLDEVKPGGVKRENIALGDDFEAIAFKVIQRAQMEGWLPQLLGAVREARPAHADLLDFSCEFGLASTPLKKRELERIVQDSNAFIPPLQWRQKLGELETRVCRIEVPTNKGMSYGTGFLLGPDLILTNYHVLEPAILGAQGKTTAKGLSASPAAVRFRFDFKQLTDGLTVNPGTVHALVEPDWLIDSSPYSPEDTKIDGTDPGTQELDYALVRVADSPGDQSVGGKQGDQDAPLRGFIALPQSDWAFPEQSALFILQHPKGDPLQLALDTQAVLRVNANKTRVRYRTNTLAGSSGSPCFNAGWELVALHHAGDPDYSAFHKPEYNQGIPLRAILDLLHSRGLDQELGRG